MLTSPDRHGLLRLGVGRAQGSGPCPPTRKRPCFLNSPLLISETSARRAKMQPRLLLVMGRLPPVVIARVPALGRQAHPTPAAAPFRSSAGRAFATRSLPRRAAGPSSRAGFAAKTVSEGCCPSLSCTLPPLARAADVLLARGNALACVRPLPDRNARLPRSRRLAAAQPDSSRPYRPRLGLPRRATIVIVAAAAFSTDVAPPHLCVRGPSARLARELLGRHQGRAVGRAPGLGRDGVP